MNNLALQTLIHLYQDPKIEYKLVFPEHWKAEYVGQEKEDLVPYFKSASKIIQKQTKFYIDARDRDNMLTTDETTKLLDDMKLYSPYDSCLIQVETEELVVHAVIINTVSDPEEKFDDQIIATQFIYHKASKTWSHDFNQYMFTRHPKKSNSEQGFPFEIRAINDLVRECIHFDHRLRNWTEGIITAYALLNIHLQFPEISKQEDVKGRPNTTIGHHKLRKHTVSEMRRMPSYEHKTLVLNMYDNDTGNGTGGKRSSGTAFHSVRKHIRKYKDGKTTFVKAHFRGSKDVGIVSKDYKIAGAQND